MEKEVEKEVFTAAVSEMRSLIEAEVKEIRRISGIPPSPDRELVNSSQSQTTMSLSSSQEDKLDDSLEGPLDEEDEFSRSFANTTSSSFSASLHGGATGRSSSPGGAPLLSSSPRSTSGGATSSGQKSFRATATLDFDHSSPPKQEVNH